MSRLAVMFVLMLAGAALSAQQAPKAGPEQAKLKYFLGEWKSEGDVKPGAMGPGGTFSETVHSEMLGEFFVVLHSNGSFAGMPLNSTAVMSYDSKESVYVYDEYNSMGEHQVSKGTVSGDDWTWKTEVPVSDGKTMHGRYLEHVIGPNSYTYKFEISDDGTKWTTIMEGKSTKM